MDIFLLNIHSLFFSMKRFYTFLTLLGIALCSVAQQLAIIAVGADGSEQSYQLSLAQDIVFAGTEQNRTMQLFLSNGTLVEGITTLLFGEMDIDIPTSITQSETVRVYAFPNPVVHTLHVHGVSDDATLRVFNLNGVQQLQTTGSHINVASLSAGTYLLQINNQIVKFIKND
jgi:hypothetical protein